MRFSERKGITKARTVLQLDAIDEPLRNGLWDALFLLYWDNIEHDRSGYTRVHSSNHKHLFMRIWHSFFRRPIDGVPKHVSEAVSEIRHFFFVCPWHEVYDFLEFVADNGAKETAAPFRKLCNDVLERELSGYRFVDRMITEISSSSEIASIEEALAAAGPFAGVRRHLETALSHLSDRANPDFRNSIKESISAVEALARRITGDNNATVAEALKVLEKSRHIHGALKSGFASLYGYTSDADGIRHAMLEEPSLSLGDAKFMLVACSAFVNYLIGKVSEANIRLT